jgi:hypothetical protein
MRSLRWVELVFSLLIVGILGGLMAPLPSEASSTSLTLQVDSGSPVPILGGTGTCPSGFNQCYLVNSTPVAFGTNSKGFKVLPAPGTLGTLPKLLINDTSQDAIKFTAVQIAPTSTSSWPNTETHVVKIVMKNTFDASPNAAGNYVFALRTGGYLKAGGTVSPLYTQFDFLRFEGTGTFSPTLVNVPLLNKAPATTNLTPLTLQVGNQATATYFTLNQVVTYPTFACDADGGASGTQCKPIITITMTVTFYGPDSLVLTDSSEAFGGGPCKLTPADGVDSPTGPVLPCHSSGKKKSTDDSITQQIINSNNIDVTTATTDEPDAVRAVQCVEADNCPCADLDDPRCAGTIVHIADVTPATIQTFPFTAVGPGILSPNYTITTDANGDGSKQFSPLPAVGQGPWTFVKGEFPLADPTHRYDLDSISCVSTLEPLAPLVIKADGFTTWTADSGSEKLSVTVHTLKGGDTLTCTWHIHKSSTK